jgi:hypothetical protein
MFKNVATKIALFAFDTTTGTPKTGDAANITAYVSKDYGTVTVLADTSATEMDATNAKGWYLFDVAQGETNADALLFTAKSSTANISVTGQYIFTTPNRFTTLVIDAAGLADANTVKLGPSGSGTAQTARDVGASVLLSSGTGTGQVSLSSGTVTVGTNNDKTGYSLTQTFPSNFASLAITVGGAVTAGTVSDKTGYSLTQAFPTNFSSLAITGGGAVTAGTVSDKTGYSLTQSFPTNFSSLAITAGGAVTAGTVSDKTGYSLTTADWAKAGDAMALTSSERNSTADALLNRNVAAGSSTGRLVKEALYVLRNKISVATGTLTVYGTDDTTAAFTATVTTTPGDPVSTVDPA